MDKLASDAYSQGAYDALQNMNIPQHIKVAAAQQMTKEASGILGRGLASAKGAISNFGDRARGVLGGEASRISSIEKMMGKMNPNQLEAIRRDLL